MAGKGDVYEEAIRLYVETEGSQGLDAVRDALASVGDVSAETIAETDKLLASLGNLNDIASKASGFVELSAQLDQTQQAYDNASTAALQLALQIGETEKPTREMLTAQKAARTEVDRLESSLTKQWQALTKADAELGKLGFNTADLASAQANLRNEIGRGADAINTQAQAVRRQAEANALLQQRTTDADEQFRRLAESGRVSAQALEEYRARAAAAAAQTDELAGSADASTGVLEKLKTVAAAAFAFISFRSVADGIKAIVDEGNQAEQALAQLESVLVSTGRQGEFTSATLLDLANSLADVSKFSGDEIANAETRLLSYTNVAAKEFPKAMQIVIDQSARLGIGLEQSAEIVGKALQTPTKAMESLGKQGFILEADQKRLLAQLEATGQTAAAQAVIMDLLTESYGGAAAAQKVGTMAGLWDSVRKGFKDFQADIANRGVLDYFKAQLGEILATTAKLSKDGTLSRWAQQAGDAIVRMAKVVRSTTGFLADHSGALVFMAKAYAALKIGQAVVALNVMRASLMTSTAAALANAGAMNTAATATARFRLALRALPGAVAIGVALVGLDLAIKGARQLGEALGANSAAAKNAEAVSERLRKQMLAEAADRQQVALGLQQYAQQAVLTAQQVAGLGEAQRAAYQQGLAGLREYLLEQNAFYLRMEAAGALTAVYAEGWAKVRARLGEVTQGLGDLKAGVIDAAAALNAQISPAAQKIIAQLGDIGRDGKLARESISSLFKDINLSDSTALGDVGLALAEIAQQGHLAERSVRDGLLSSLQQLSGEELLRFQSSATAAFDEFKKGPAEVAAILDTTLLAAMQKLGISAEQMGLQFTQAGKDGTAAFATILENANATSAQIETAFKAALSKVATLDEARALGNLLEAAGVQGKVGFDQAERAAAALRARLGEIQNATSPLVDEFGRLGIKSKAELDRARDAARDAFEAIRAGAGRGEAAIEDVRAAFGKYAEAARAAAVNSDGLAKARVDNELGVLEAVYNVNTGLKDMADAGKQAGQSVASGAGQAAAALQDVATAAGGAAGNVKKAGDETEKAGENMEYGSKKGKQFALSMYEVSDAAIAATMATNRLAGSTLWTGAINRVTGQINEQGDALRKQVEQLQAANAEFDEMAGRRKELSQQYNLLGAGEIEKLLQAETQLEANRKRAAEQRVREAEQAAKAAEPKAGQPAAAAAVVQIAQREAAAAAVAVTDMLDSTKQAAVALASAATSVRTAVAGEVVVRVVSEGGAGGVAPKLSEAQMRYIAGEVVRLIRQSKGSST